ncbi:hypothetical protein RFI_20234, partial [Reticulomyxa filosa]
SDIQLKDKDQQQYDEDSVKNTANANANANANVFLNVNKDEEKEKAHNAKTIADENDEVKMAKYTRMKAAGVPIASILNRMKLDHVPSHFIQQLSANESSCLYCVIISSFIELATMKELEKEQVQMKEKEKEEEEEEEMDAKAMDDLLLEHPELTKYRTLEKLGTPLNAIRNRMKVDGIESQRIAYFLSIAGHKDDHEHEHKHEVEHEHKHKPELEAESKSESVGVIQATKQLPQKYIC